MWLNKKESEKALSFLMEIQKSLEESHKRELFLQKQFINVAHLFPKIIDDFNYCNECSLFHYSGQHFKQELKKE
jgi:hypothetical protein